MLRRRKSGCQKTLVNQPRCGVHTISSYPVPGVFGQRSLVYSGFAEHCTPVKVLITVWEDPSDIEEVVSEAIEHANKEGV